ncbi:hypothetical protein LACDD01_01548 [Lactococcus sp. DD01]|nr:hypothetical protein LACDD01_01548 [Lactococcus sp. DD01]
MLANVSIKNYSSSKVRKVVLVLAIIGLTAVFITKNNPKVTPMKGTRLVQGFGGK